MDDEICSVQEALSIHLWVPTKAESDELHLKEFRIAPSPTALQDFLS